MNTFKRWLSTKAYKRVKLYIFAAIIILNILVVLVGGILIHLTDPEAYGSIWMGVWQAFTDILDPGFLSNYANGIIKPATIAVEVVVILVCMVSFTGAIIGYISSLITSIIDNADAGPKQMYLKNHILILNWNNRAAGIISEYLYTEICEEVVVLTANDRNVVNKEIEDSILELGYGKNQKHVSFTVVQGEPFSYSELIKVCAEHAKTIIVLSDGNQQGGDLRTLKTVMMVSQLNKKRKDCAIVVETDNRNIYELIRRMPEKEIASDDTDNYEGESDSTKPSKKNADNEVAHANIIPAYLNKLLGKLMAHITLQPELNIIFAELFSHNGKEFYSIPGEKLDYIDWNNSDIEVVAEFMRKHSCSIPLITSKSFANQKTNRMFVIADKESESHVLRTSNAVYNDKLKINTGIKPPFKEIIVLGSNSKMQYMINSFNAYMDNYGAECLKVHFVGTDAELKAVPKHPQYVIHKIQDRYNILEIRKVLHKFDLRTISTISILSDDTVSTVEYDSGALIALVNINRELEKIPKGDKRPEVVVEILNPKNHEIVQQYNFNNVIVSNKYISSMMAQLGDDDSIFEMIYDILTFDNEVDDFEQAYSNNDESRELYVERCGDLFVEMPSFDSFGQMILSVFESSNRKYIPIGIIYADNKKNYVSIDKKEKIRNYTFPADLDKEREVKLTPDDKLIVFASEW